MEDISDRNNLSLNEAGFCKPARNRKGGRHRDTSKVKFAETCNEMIFKNEARLGLFCIFYFIYVARFCHRSVVYSLIQVVILMKYSVDATFYYRGPEVHKNN